MQIYNVITILLIIGLTSTIFYAMFRVSKYAFLLNIIILSVFVFYITEGNELVSILLYLACPLMLINIGLYVFLHKTENVQNGDTKYQVNFATTKGNFKLEANIFQPRILSLPRSRVLSIMHVKGPVYL